MSNVARIGALLFWLAFVVALLFPLPPKLDSLLVLAGLLILFFHAVELVLVFTLWKQRLKPNSADVLPVMLYGAFYLRPRLLASR